MPERAASVSAARHAFTFVASRVARIRARRATCCSRTLWLSTSRMSTGSSFASLYLLTPTITSAPESTHACFCAALASIFSLAQPLATALTMPPIASTSSMMACAFPAICWVSVSIM